MIYETRGRAREYFELAANLYRGCEHSCVYCYGPDVLNGTRVEYFRRGVPKEGALAALERDAARLARNYEDRRILLSFVTDPYQPAEKEYQLTRQAITILHKAHLNVAILTKGGLRAARDFDLLNKFDCFGVTLTFINQGRSLSWEPKAALPINRMLSLKYAHEKGIPTWVSLEPVIDGAESLALIEETAEYVDHYKVGKLNYENRLPKEFETPKVNWKQFAQNVIILLDRLGKSYYIKKDLAKFVGKPDGITKGGIWT